MADPRVPESRPTTTTTTHRRAGGGTVLGWVLGLLLVAGLVWWAVAANNQDDDLATTTTTTSGSGVATSTTDSTYSTTTETDVGTAISSGSQGDVDEFGVSEDVAGDEVGQQPGLGDQPGSTTTVGSTETEDAMGSTTGTDTVGSTGTTTTDDETLGSTGSSAGGTGDMEDAIGGDLGSTTGQELTIGRLEDEVDMLAGQTIKTTATIAQEAGENGFWIERDGERMFAIMADDANLASQADVQEGQEVRLTGTVVRVDDSESMPELADLSSADRQKIEGEQAILQVQEIEVVQEAATR